MSQETFFHEALATPPDQRAAYLDAVCAGQPKLRADIEALLSAYEDTGNPLDRPPPGVRPNLDRDTPLDPLGPTTLYQPPVEPGLVIAGRYSLIHMIGEGGMAAVWLAQQTEPIKRKVALKLIKASLNSKAVLSRFEQERQALALMDHPNIARVLDGGLTPDGRPFFVMDMVNGLALNRFCDQARLSVRQRLELFVPICQAVQHAHQKGIIHRDLKPGNILVTSVDAKPVPKVIDFGLAKATAGSLIEELPPTQHGTMLGTLEYMAPEQSGYDGVDIDTRADIYALGVILYELLTGLRPMDSKRLREAAWPEMLRILREEEPPRPSVRLSRNETLPSLALLRQTEARKLPASLRGELDWVVMKCLEKQRDHRYETASSLVRDIQRYLSDEPVEARPPSTRYRLSKFLRRNKGPVLAASLVLLALLAGMVGTTMMMVQAEKARDREAVQRDKAEKAEDGTWQTLDLMTSSMAEDWLATQKITSEEEKKFLEGVLSFFRQFAGDKADDRQSRARTAQAAYRVGAIEYRLGRYEQALAALLQAHDNFENLAADFSDVTQYRQKLAASDNYLGLVLAGLGKPREAEQRYRNALALFETLTPDFPEANKDLARSHTNLGNLLGSLGRHEEAELQYRSALALLDKLTVDFLQEPEYLQASAASHYNLGVVLADQMKRPEALKQYAKAIAIQTKLTTDFPTERLYRKDLARSRNGMGTLLVRIEKLTEAEQQYRLALILWERLTDQFPSEPEYRKALAVSYSNLGNVLSRLQKPTEAEQHHRDALAHINVLTAQFRYIPEYRRTLASSHHNFAGWLVGRKRFPEAEEQYTLAQTIQEKLIADFPDKPQYQQELGLTYFSFGRQFHLRKRPGETLVWYEKAIGKLTPVCNQHPQLVEAKKDLCLSHYGRALAYDLLGKYPEAVKDWDKAIELGQQAEQPGFRLARATSLIQGGQVAKAIAAVADLEKASNWSFGQWYVFASVYALASTKSADRKQEYADRAMAMLHKAVKVGYTNAAHMREDANLKSLREREDFKNLIRELEKKPVAGNKKRP